MIDFVFFVFGKLMAVGKRNLFFFCGLVKFFLESLNVCYHFQRYFELNVNH